MEQQNSQGNQCLAKVAELSSAAKDLPDYLCAAEIYEALGKHCLDSNLLKYNAKGHLLQCALCRLANRDTVGAEQAMARFSSMDCTLRESREVKFADELIACADSGDTEGFPTACFEFDRNSKLDPWKTTILLTVRKNIDGGGDGLDGDDNDFDLT